MYIYTLLVIYIYIVIFHVDMFLYPNQVSFFIATQMTSGKGIDDQNEKKNKGHVFLQLDIILFYTQIHVF